MQIIKYQPKKAIREVIDGAFVRDNQTRELRLRTTSAVLHDRIHDVVGFLNAHEPNGFTSIVDVPNAKSDSVVLLTGRVRGPLKELLSELEALLDREGGVSTPIYNDLEAFFAAVDRHLEVTKDAEVPMPIPQASSEQAGSTATEDALV